MSKHLEFWGSGAGFTTLELVNTSRLEMEGFLVRAVLIRLDL